MSKFIGRIEISDRQTLEVWASKGQVEFHNVSTEIIDVPANLNLAFSEKLRGLLKDAETEASKMALRSEEE